MNNYRNEIPSPFQVKKYDRKDPLRTDIERNIGKFNLEVTVEEDKNTLALFKHVPGPIIAYIATLRKDSEVVGIGRGLSVLSKMNKYVDRAVRFAFNASLIDSVVHSTKALDALYLKTNTEKIPDEIDLEKRDEPAFYSDSDMPQYATEKQRAFLSQLLEKCNNSSKEEYQEKLDSPYLSRFDASELISSLLPMK
jgi:hypothetical protein